MIWYDPDMLAGVGLQLATRKKEIQAFSGFIFTDDQQVCTSLCDCNVYAPNISFVWTVLWLPLVCNSPLF